MQDRWTHPRLVGGVLAFLLFVLAPSPAAASSASGAEAGIANLVIFGSTALILWIPLTVLFIRSMRAVSAPLGRFGRFLVILCLVVSTLVALASVLGILFAGHNYFGRLTTLAVGWAVVSKEHTLGLSLALMAFSWFSLKAGAPGSRGLSPVLLAAIYVFALVWGPVSQHVAYRLKMLAPSRAFDEASHWKRSIAFAPDGKGLYAGEAGYKKPSAVCLWPLDKGGPIRRYEAGEGLRSIAVSPDGTWLAAATASCGIALWKTEAAKPVRVFPHRKRKEPHLAFCAQSKALVAGTADGSVFRIDLETLEETSLAKANILKAVRDLACSPAGDVVALARAKGITVMKTDSGEAVREIDLGHLVECVAMSRDGSLVAGAGYDYRKKRGMIAVWSLKDGKEVGRVHAPRKQVAAIDFTRSGDSMIGALLPGKVCLWAIRDGSLQRQFIDLHASKASSLAVSPDGGLLATGWSRNPATLLLFPIDGR